MMTQQNVLELAKQGNPQAIRALIERSLKPKGITVKVGLKNNCLIVIAESLNTPNRSFMEDFIRTGIQNLEPQSVKRVAIQAHKTGYALPIWRAEFNLEGNAIATAAPATDLGYNTIIQKEEAIAQPPRTNSFNSQTPPNQLPKKSGFNLFFSCVKFILFTFLYLISAASFVIIAISLKLGAILLAEKYFYNIQVIGELFRGIEIIELLNILVFAIIGMGFGVATALLPRKSGRYISTLLLMILVPIIYSTTYFYRYDSWIQEVAEKEKISYIKAEELTNSYLKNRLGRQGFLGFYIHTAEFPILPTKKNQMKEVADRERQITYKFAYVTGLKPEKITAIFTISAWGIRVFYFFIAAFATIIHFREGLIEIQRFFKKAQ